MLSPKFVEPSQSDFGKFYDGSKMKWSYKSAQNRLKLMRDDVLEEWMYRHVTNDENEILIKNLIN